VKPCPLPLLLACVLRLASMRNNLITMEQVLKKELLEFQQRHIDPGSASLLPESLSLQLFGYITLVKDGHSLGRLHAVNHWKGGTATGKFNGVRIHPGRGRSTDLEYARLLLVFQATLCDGNTHELALVRHHALVRRSKTIASVECSDVYLSETGCSVIRVTDIVDSWTLLPDFTGGFAAAMAEPNRLVAGNYLL